MSTQPNLTFVGAMYIILGVLNLMVALLLFAAMGAQDIFSGNAHAAMVAMSSDFRLVVASASLLGGLLTFTGGVGLLKRKSWAWGLVWVLAWMGLLSFPIGTIVGASALWVLTRSEVRQSLGIDGLAMKRTIKVTAALSLLLIIAAYPACQLAEPIVQAELSKLSPEERELRQFDMVYARWVLPGVFAALWGTMLGGVAIVSWFVERRRIRKSIVPPPIVS